MNPTEKNVLCVIPARGGSKGVPNKNLRILNGKPLVWYAINTALKSSLIDKVVVSTNSEEIAQTARSFGAEAPFLRPAEISRDLTPLFPVLIHAIEYFDKHGWFSDIVVSFQPTSPFTRLEDIEAGISKLLETNCDSVSSVCRVERYHPCRALKVEDDRVYPLNDYTTEKYPSRQERPAVYSHNGAFYIRKRSLLDEWKGEGWALGRDVRAIVMDEIHSVNIDSILDLKLAEVILKEGL